jgi:hypothetical protein
VRVQLPMHWCIINMCAHLLSACDFTVYISTVFMFYARFEILLACIYPTFSSSMSDYWAVMEMDAGNNWLHSLSHV